MSSEAATLTRDRVSGSGEEDKGHSEAGRKTDRPRRPGPIYGLLTLHFPAKKEGRREEKSVSDISCVSLAILPVRVAFLYPGQEHDGRMGWTGQTGQHISLVSW